MVNRTRLKDDSNAEIDKQGSEGLSVFEHCTCQCHPDMIMAVIINQQCACEVGYICWVLCKVCYKCYILSYWILIKTLDDRHYYFLFTTSRKSEIQRLNTSPNSDVYEAIRQLTYKYTHYIEIKLYVW